MWNFVKQLTFPTEYGSQDYSRELPARLSIPGEYVDDTIEPLAASTVVHELPGSTPQDTGPPLSRLSQPFDPYLAQSDLNTRNIEPSEASDGMREQLSGVSNVTNEPLASILRNSHSGGKAIAKLKPTRRSKPSNVNRSSIVAPKSLVIVVFGVTGTGKSSLINKLTDADVKIGHTLQSETSEIHEVSCQLDGKEVTLVDTPGFDDTLRSDTEILQLIASWLKEMYDDKIRLTGMIYLHRISDNRMSGSSYRNLQLFRSLCGSKTLPNVMLATTMWDKVSQAEGGQREKDLLSDDGFWGQLHAAGATASRYDNTVAGAQSLVKTLLQMSPVVLQIQHEMSIEHKELIDTEAGQQVSLQLKKMEAKHKEDLNVIKSDYEKAIGENDRKWLEELRKSEAELTRKIEENERSMEILRKPINTKAFYHRRYRCVSCKIPILRSNTKSGKCPCCGVSQIFV